MNRFRWIFLVLICAMLTASLAATLACGGDDDDDDTSGGDDDDDSGDDDDDTGDDDDDGAFAEAEANSGTWVWIDVDGMNCRDGSATGIGVRLQDGATKVGLYLEGGGVCYDPGSCDGNDPKYDEGDFDAKIADGGLADGIWDAANAANPLADWNFIYIPYCTGDLHAGVNPEGQVPGLVETQMFVGYENIGAVLDLAAPYFADAESVFLFGSSAGGLGTMMNYGQVADAFAPTAVAHLDDSAPLFAADDALSPCLQFIVELLWGVDQIVPEDCDCLADNGDGLSGLHAYWSETYTGGTFGLFSSYADETMTDFFGAGQDNCTGTEPIPEAVYRAGLEDLRDNVMDDSWGTYFIEGDTHTIVGDQALFYGTNVDDTAFTDWLADLVGGTVSDVAE